MPVVIPPPDGATGYVELSRKPQGGRILEKHILTRGPLVHPKTGRVISIDDAFVRRLKENFDSGVVPHVQLPLADAQNRHDERPDRNLGEVLDIRERNGKIYAVLEARKQSEDFGVTLLDASAMVDLDALDTRTNQKVGPALLHVAVTNRPHLVDLEGYTDTIAASADLDGEVVMLSYPEEGTAVPTDQLTARDIAGAIAELAGSVGYLAQLTGNADSIRNNGPSFDDQEEILRLTSDHPKMLRQDSASYPEYGTATDGEVLRLTADPRHSKLFGLAGAPIPRYAPNAEEGTPTTGNLGRSGTGPYSPTNSGPRGGSVKLPALMVDVTDESSEDVSHLVGQPTAGPGTNMPDPQAVQDEVDRLTSSYGSQVSGLRTGDVQHRSGGGRFSGPVPGRQHRGPGTVSPTSTVALVTK